MNHTRSITVPGCIAAQHKGVLSGILGLLAGAMVASAPNVAAAASTAPARRPNILVIMSDEHNVDVTGCYDNAIVRTPNLDRLAEGGITFDAAYTNSPLCVPSRLAFTAGKYISRTGAWSNNCWLPSEDYPSIARVMTEAGYDAVVAGKMHYDVTRCYGFRRIAAEPRNNIKNGRGGRRSADDLTVNRNAGEVRFRNFYPDDDSSVMRPDRRVTEAVVEFLSNRTDREQPFFLVAGYLAPHFPLIVPEKYWARYRDRVPMPVIPDNLLASLPLNYQHLRAGFGLVDVDPDIVKKGRELYYGLTEWFDDQVGLVLRSLEEGGLADNTIVIYTTDHGENMGEHGLWWKNCMYEHSARVPLIVHWPARWSGGQRRAGVCSLVDLVQTIAELGGARVPDDWDGDSLVDYLDDPQAQWKDFAVSEYYAHNIASGFAMFRQNRYKYVYHTRADEKHPPQRELYDMHTDPQEFQNLADDSAQQERIERMHALLVRELGEAPDRTEQRARRDLARGYDRPPVEKPKP